MDSFCKHIFPLINMYKTIRSGADLVEVCRNAPPPPHPSLPGISLYQSINQISMFITLKYTSCSKDSNVNRNHWPEFACIF